MAREAIAREKARFEADGKERARQEGKQGVLAEKARREEKHVSDALSELEVKAKHGADLSLASVQQKADWAREHKRIVEEKMNAVR